MNIKIDFSKFLDITTSSLKQNLPSFCEKIKARDLGFYTSINEKGVEEIENFAKQNRENFETIVIVGIGGSSVGFQAIWGALENKINKKVYFIDDVDSEFVKKQTEQINCSRTLFLFISKSGSTVETVANFSYFWENFPRENFVFISEEGSYFHKIAQKNKLPFFIHPKNIGGRFAVLSVVGMLPAALCGLNIREFLAGANLVYKDFLNTDFEKNICFQLAIANFLAYQKGYSNVVFWPYSKKLNNLGQWFNQLLSESLGKNSKGITPILANGVGAQHSVLQNFIDGENDKFFIFPHLKKLNHNKKIPQIPQSNEFSYLKNKSFQDLLNAEFFATRDSLIEKGRPVLTFEIDEISPKTLGEFFALWMGTSAFLGELLELNAFNQPGVERAKVLAREGLGKV
jgi:glucose-6-phosphate isomerase